MKSYETAIDLISLLIGITSIAISIFVFDIQIKNIHIKNI